MTASDSFSERTWTIESFGEKISPSLDSEPTIHPTARVLNSRLGEWTEIDREVRMYESELGHYSYCMERCQFDYATVGKFTSIASDVRLGPAEHPTGRPTQHHMTYRRAKYDFAETDGEEVFARRREQPVAIGHDVWIGHSVTVMPDVTIGTGAVVGAGAIVTTDVEPYEIVAGVPAEPIDRRFHEETAERLLDTQWWDWSRETIEKRFAEFRDLKTFIENYG
jgi:phosphonate metabolism protein (transferase hexapeptide repeat family)